MSSRVFTLDTGERKVALTGWLWCVCQNQFKLERLAGAKEEHRWLIFFAPGVPVQVPERPQDVEAESLDWAAPNQKQATKEQYLRNRAIEQQRAWERQEFSGFTEALYDAFAANETLDRLAAADILVGVITGETPEHQRHVELYQRFLCEKVRTYSDWTSELANLLRPGTFQFGMQKFYRPYAVAINHGKVTHTTRMLRSPGVAIDAFIRNMDDG